MKSAWPLYIEGCGFNAEALWIEQGGENTVLNLAHSFPIFSLVGLIMMMEGGGLKALNGI